jgi:hypothetical protein
MQSEIDLSRSAFWTLWWSQSFLAKNIFLFLLDRFNDCVECVTRLLRTIELELQRQRC